jgi:selenium metabolism protein YedF
MTRNLLSEGPVSEGLCVWVDNGVAAENVRRFLENAGVACEVAEEGGTFAVRTQGAGLSPSLAAIPVREVRQGEGRRILVMLANDRIGQGDPELGAGLMKNFVSTLGEMGEGLWRIVCVNEAVRLTVADAQTLDALRGLEARGVGILVCGTCLAHYGLTEKRAVGSSTNMLDIVTSLEVADSVINL